MIVIKIEFMRSLTDHPRHMSEPCSLYCENIESASSRAAAEAITLASSPKEVI